MSDKSTCAFGAELEHYIVQKMVELGIPASKSKGSGNQGQIADINNPYFIVECKNKSTESITVDAKVWAKLKSEVPLHSKRLPLYVLRNKNKQTWAVMDVDDFFTILKGYLENLNGRV
jgi:Holliday junction resolvase